MQLVFITSYFFGSGALVGDGWGERIPAFTVRLAVCPRLLPILTDSPHSHSEPLHSGRHQFRTSDLITTLSLKPLLSQWWRASCVLVAACLSRASARLPSPGQLPKLLINTDRVDFLIMGTSTVLNFNLLEGFRLLNLHG